MNNAKLRGKIAERGITAKGLSEAIGINPATFYRKVKRDGFTCNEARKIAEVLHLTSDEACEIFLG